MPCKVIDPSRLESSMPLITYRLTRTLILEVDQIERIEELENTELLITTKTDCDYMLIYWDKKDTPSLNSEYCGSRCATSFAAAFSDETKSKLTEIKTLKGKLLIHKIDNNWVAQNLRFNPESKEFYGYKINHGNLAEMIEDGYIDLCNHGRNFPYPCKFNNLEL